MIMSDTMSTEKNRHKTNTRKAEDRPVNEPHVNSLKPLTDTRAPQPQQKAYNPWNSQPTEFGTNNGFDNPPF